MKCPWCQEECYQEKLGIPESPLSYHLCRCGTENENFELYLDHYEIHSFILRANINTSEQYIILSWINDEDHGQLYKVAIKDRKQNKDINIITRGSGPITPVQGVDMLKRYLKLLVFI